jgi:phage pi2 protein 07
MGLGRLGMTLMKRLVFGPRIPYMLVGMGTLYYAYYHTQLSDRAKVAKIKYNMMNGEFLQEYEDDHEIRNLSAKKLLLISGKDHEKSTKRVKEFLNQENRGVIYYEVKEHEDEKTIFRSMAENLGVDHIKDDDNVYNFIQDACMDLEKEQKKRNIMVINHVENILTPEALKKSLDAVEFFKRIRDVLEFYACDVILVGNFDKDTAKKISILAEIPEERISSLQIK